MNTINQLINYLINSLILLNYFIFNIRNSLVITKKI